MDEPKKQTRAEILEELNRPTDPAILEKIRREQRAISNPGQTLGGVIMFVAFLGLVGYLFRQCTKPPSAEELAQMAEASALADAQTRVRARLKDPASAQFRSVRMVVAKGDTVVCGLVNAKNGFGGYTGEQPFVVKQGSVVMAETLSKLQDVAAFEPCL